MDQEKLIIKEHKRSDGTILAEILINNPKKFNVLDLDIISSLKKHLEKWNNQKDVALVYIHSAGEKAFCAGGDVKSLYYEILKCKKEKTDPGVEAQKFFGTEYQMNFLMHTYKKPIVLWGNGFVMGGGLGLFAGSSHPIVTESTTLSMPEIAIGLFPDVGGTYFLNKLPKNIGLYLALTSCRINATEALFLNMSQLAFKDSSKEQVFNFLMSESFKDKEDFNSKILQFQTQKGFKPEQENWIEKHQNEINNLLESKDIHTIYKNFQDSTIDDKKWQKNKEAFMKGSPSSEAVICEQLKRGLSMNLKEIFQMELVMAMQFSRQHDFVEGVRAVLVDKTGDPSWNPKSIADIKSSWVEEHFKPLSGWENPLKEL